jgi:hypothetical protein
VYPASGDSKSVGGSDRSSSSDASDKGCTPKAPRMFVVAFALVLLEMGALGRGEEPPIACETVVGLVCSRGVDEGDSLAKRGEPNNCEDTAWFVLKAFSCGEFCNGSGLSVGSLLKSNVAEGVSGEAVGRLGERTLVIGLGGSTFSTF